MKNNWPETIDELLDECQRLIGKYDLYTLGKRGEPFTHETEPRVDGTEYLAGEFQYGVAMIPAQWVRHVLSDEDGQRFERVRECEFKWTGRYCPPGCMVPQDMVQTCSACGGLGNDPSRPFHPDDPNEPIQFTNLPNYIRYCPLCGAKVVSTDE